MSKYSGMGEPVRIVRDAGYKKEELLSPEYRRKVKERVEDPILSLEIINSKNF